jgi:hypothetical protein
MKRFVRSSVLAAAALSLAACSSGPKLGGGKQGAAQALYQASDSTSEKGQNAVMKRAFAQDITLDGAITVNCTHGGTATMEVDLDSITSTDTSVTLAFDIEYDECNEDGKNALSGDMTMGFLIGTDGADSFELALRMKGELDISGEVDDYIDADVTQYIGFNGTSGQVTTKINGTIATRSGEYVYNNETFTFAEAGVLPVAADDDAELDD